MLAYLLSGIELLAGLLGIGLVVARCSDALVDWILKQVTR